MGDARREAGYQFIIDRSAELKGVIEGLSPIAKHSFDRIDRIARS